MTARRARDFDLDQAVADPGFTPRRSDVPALLDRVARGGEAALLSERALSRLGEAAARAASERAESAEPAARARLIRLAGKLGARAPEPEIVEFLVQHLDDADERPRRAAATALGKMQGERVASALSAALAKESSASVQRALVEALGKVGGEHALEILDRLALGEGAERARARARLIAGRTLLRAERASLDTRCPAPGPISVAFRCRRGLEDFLLSELGREADPRLSRREPGGTRVAATLTGPLEGIFRARTMLSFAFPLPEISVPSPEGATDAIITALTSPEARRIFEHYTQGPVRYRIVWARGGKRRARVFQIAEDVARVCPEIVNDPTQSLWDVVIYEAPGALRVELAPRLEDPRFAYRVGDVPAASHPTIAAALARTGGVHPDDVVWDPFVGSGLELCERSFLGSYRLLIGSDVDPMVLPIARENLAAAGVPEERRVLIAGDACVLPPPARPTLIITNPPLGRRVQRRSELAQMLERFVDHAARLLAPRGRLVWISPFPARTEAAARRQKLVPIQSQEIDMGGFSARLQSFVK